MKPKKNTKAWRVWRARRAAYANIQKNKPTSAAMRALVMKRWEK